MNRSLIVSIALGALTLSAPAYAQDKDMVPDASDAVRSKQEKDGLDSTLTVGATINFVDNRNVVGQNEGSTWNLGGTVKGGTEYKKGANEVRGALSITENFSRTPIIPEFINSADEAILEASYYYNIIPWAGVFARAEGKSNLFNNYFVSATPVSFAITELDGSVTQQGPQDRLLLKDGPFGLSILKQSVGGFVRPIREDYLDLELRLGAGAQEIFAADQVAVSDDAATANLIEAKRLQNSQQIGAEFGMALKGTLSKDRVVYKSTLEVLTPFYNSINPQDKSAFELTNFESLTQISFKLVEWASLDYQIKVVRQPLIIDEVQVQNSLLLTFGYTLIEAAKKK